MKRNVVRSLVVLVVLLAAACDVPDPGTAQLVSLDWGSGIQPNVRDVPYGTELGCPAGSDEICGGSQELDIYRARAGGNKGTLVFFHGGGFLFGDKYPLTIGGNLRRQLRRGYSIVSVNYRMPAAARDEVGQPIVVPSPSTGWLFAQNAGGNGFPDAMADVAAALQWVYDTGPSHGLSTETVVVAGHSAGGTMAALAGTADDSSDPVFAGMPPVDGWVAVSPMVDWDLFADGERWGEVWMGAEFAQYREVSRLANHLDRDDPPGYIVHGVYDGIVPASSVQVFQDQLRQADEVAYFRVNFDMVDRLADGRAMQGSTIGQPDPRGHNPVGGMNADWFDRWLNDR